MKSNAIKVNAKDNVAVVVHPVTKGSPVVVDGQHLLDAVEDIPLGHKVALLALPGGVADIPAGGWVHVHNTRPILSDV